MKEESIQDILNILVREHRELAKKVEELKKQQEMLKNEIKIQNVVLTSIPMKSELIN